MRSGCRDQILKIWLWLSVLRNLLMPDSVPLNDLVRDVFGDLKGLPISENSSYGEFCKKTSWVVPTVDTRKPRWAGGLVAFRADFIRLATVDSLAMSREL